MHGVFEGFFQRGFVIDFVREVVDKTDEVAQGVFGAGGVVAVDKGVVGEDLPQADAVLLRVLAQISQGFLADAARRGVDDAFEGAIVIAVAGETQVGERVFDFGALEEAQAAIDAVGQAVLQEHFFEDARLGVGAVEDGAVVVTAACRLPALDFGADVACFVVFVNSGVDAHRRTACAVAPQGFAETLAVLRNDGVGGIEDGLG
mgnify:CR=1 FL=1